MRIIAALLLAATITAVSEERWYQLREENDAFVDSTDNAYTQGLEFERINGWEPIKGGRQRTRYSARNMVYTPADITLAEPPPTDRPYGGMTAATYTVERSEGPVVTSTSWLVGIIGPSSGSDTVQTEFHALAGFTHPEGWDTQLADEPAVNMAVRWDYRWLQFKGAWDATTDLTPYAATAVGSVFDHAEAGLTWRGGFNMPDAEITHEIRPNAMGLAWTPVCFAFASISERYVLHNTFVDGSLMQSGPGVDSTPLVASASGGLTFGVMHMPIRGSAYSFLITAAQNQRAREYDGQDAQPKYGTISIAFGKTF